MTPDETIAFTEERVRLMVKTFMGTVTATTEWHSKECESNDKVRCQAEFKKEYIGLLGQLLSAELEEAIVKEYTT